MPGGRMNIFRYPVRSLTGDYLRAGIGLAVGLSVLASAPASVTVVVIFGSLTVLFLGFAYRTVRRNLMRVAVTAEAIRGSGRGAREVPWDQLNLLKLRYFGTRRQRQREDGAGSGFMQLTLAGAGASLTLESSIEGFEYIAWRAAKAARDNGVGLDPASAGNLLELGVDADEAGPAPEIKPTRSF